MTVTPADAAPRAGAREKADARAAKIAAAFHGVIEPVKIYRRGRLRAYTSFSPLTRLVDAARPDPRPARQFRLAVDRLLDSSFSDEVALRKVRSELLLWRATHTDLQRTFRTSPALAEMESLSLDLAKVATIGAEAVGMVTTGREIDAVWLDTRLGLLETAREPRGEAELIVIDPVLRLLCTAAGDLGADAPGCQSAADETGASGH